MIGEFDVTYEDGETFKVQAWSTDVLLIPPCPGGHMFEPEGARALARALFAAADRVAASLAEEARVERIMAEPDE